jgi:hypothetical protein
MPQPEYDPVFSAKAWEALLRFSRRRQARVAHIAFALADFPFRVSDYQTADSTGRSLENIEIDGFILTYWPDHAVRELRIVEIVEL